MPHGAVPFPFGKCRICNDKATGVHYGVATCEGCKGFYKRSIPKGDKYRCYFGGICIISPENRNRCKACRFKKCLEQGMAVEAVKMGRIPKVEKERALEQVANMKTEPKDTKCVSPLLTANMESAADPGITTCSKRTNSLKRHASESFSFEGDSGNHSWDSMHTESTSSNHTLPHPNKKFNIGCHETVPKQENIESRFPETGFSSVRLSEAMSVEHACNLYEMQTSTSDKEGLNADHMSTLHSSLDSSLTYRSSEFSPSKYTPLHNLERTEEIHRGYNFPGDHCNNDDSFGRDSNSFFPHSDYTVDSGQSSASVNMLPRHAINEQEITTLQPVDHSFAHFRHKHFDSGDSKIVAIGNDHENGMCAPHDFHIEPRDRVPHAAECGLVDTGQMSSDTSYCVKEEPGIANQCSQPVINRQDQYQDSDGKIGPETSCGPKVSSSGNWGGGYDPGPFKGQFQKPVQGMTAELRDMLLKKFARSLSHHLPNSGPSPQQSVVHNSLSYTSTMGSKTLSSPDLRTSSGTTINICSPLTSISCAARPEFCSKVASSSTSLIQQHHGNGIMSSEEKSSMFWAAGEEYGVSRLHETVDNIKQCMNSSSHSPSFGKESLPGSSASFDGQQWHPSLDSEHQAQHQYLVFPEGGSEQPHNVFQSLPSCLSQSGTQSLSIIQPASIMQSLPNRMFDTNSPAAHDPQRSFTDEFCSTSQPSKAGRSSNAGQIYYGDTSRHVQIDPKQSSPHSIPDPHQSESNHPNSYKFPPKCYSHRSDSVNSNSNSLTSAHSESLSSMNNNLTITCPAAEPRSCGLDLSYLCQDQLRDRHESTSMSETSSPVVNSENPKVNLNLSFLSDPQMKEAVIVLDNHTFSIFEIGLRRSLRDKYLKMKHEDRSADVPPTVSSHLEMYPLLLEHLSGPNPKIIRFCQVVPGFAKLDTADQKILLKRAYYDIWMLTSSEYFVEGESYLMVKEDVFYVRRHMEKIMGAEHTQTFHMFSQQFNALGLSHLEVAIMCCIQLTAPSHDQQTDLKDVKEIQKLNSFYLDLLVAVVTLIHPDTCSRVLVDIFRLVPFLAEINRLQRELIGSFSISHPAPAQKMSSQDAGSDVQQMCDTIC